MKKSILCGLHLLLFLACVQAGPSFAQAPESDPQPPASTTELKSNIERFVARRGTLLVKKFGKVKPLRALYDEKMEIQTLVISEPYATKPAEMYGVRFEIPPASRTEIRRTGFIDFDEAIGLIEAVDQMVKMVGELKPDPDSHTEVNFVSRGNITVGFFQSDDDKNVFVQIQGKAIYYRRGEMIMIRAALSEAIAELKGAGAKE